MESPYFFIVKPVGNEYNNEVEIAGKSIIVNSSVEDHNHVNRYAEVVQAPKRDGRGVSKGDIIVVHHNIFRVYYDIKGNPKKSPNYFKDGLYFIDEDQFYLYNDGSCWKSVGEFCFVKPIDKEDKYLYEDGFEENKGIVVYGNEHMTSLGVNKGDTVSFTKDSEYEFNVEGELVYRMRTIDICAIHD